MTAEFYSQGLGAKTVKLFASHLMQLFNLNDSFLLRTSTFSNK